MKYKKRINRLIKGSGRGSNLITIFSVYVNNINKKSVLDIGCGFGAITLDFARNFKTVYSIDNGKKQISVTKERVKENKLKNVTVKRDNALNLKTNKKFDVIHMSGVFEWLKLGKPNKKARYAQNMFLKNIKKHMKDGAILYSGTENKMFPYFWINDPHYKMSPLTVLLPEGFSDWIFKVFRGKRYMPKIYSYWTLRKMFKRHFKKVDFLVPIPHYQYVFEFANINNKKEIIKKCNSALRKYKLDPIQKFTIRWIRFWARLGLIKLFTPGFLTIARK